MILHYTTRNLHQPFRPCRERIPFTSKIDHFLKYKHGPFQVPTYWPFLKNWPLQISIHNGLNGRFAFESVWLQYLTANDSLPYLHPTFDRILPDRKPIDHLGRKRPKWPVCNHHIWPPYLTILFDHHIWPPYMIFIDHYIHHVAPSLFEHPVFDNSHLTTLHLTALYLTTLHLATLSDHSIWPISIQTAVYLIFPIWLSIRSVSIWPLAIWPFSIWPSLFDRSLFDHFLFTTFNLRQSSYLVSLSLASLYLITLYLTTLIWPLSVSSASMQPI